MDMKDGHARDSQSCNVRTMFCFMRIFGIMWFENNASAYTRLTSIETYTCLFVSKMSMGKQTLSKFDQLRTPSYLNNDI